MVNTSQTTMDVVELLKQDHETVESLLSEVKSEQGGKRLEVLKTIRREFLLHSDVEEQIVYPAYKECMDSREARVDVAESVDEHRLVKELIEQMLDLDPGSVQFDGKLKLLRESIQHHVKEEEQKMFPEMRQECSEDQLRTLARRVEEMKQKQGKKYG